MSAKKKRMAFLSLFSRRRMAAGCQSYMGDGVSMVFFTVDDEVKDHFIVHGG